MASTLGLKSPVCPISSKETCGWLCLYRAIPLFAPSTMACPSPSHGLQRRVIAFLPVPPGGGDQRDGARPGAEHAHRPPPRPARGGPPSDVATHDQPPTS